MVRYYLSLTLVLGLLSTGYAITRLHNAYDSEDKISAEFENVYNGEQPKQFRIVNDTPTLTALQNGEVCIFSSGTYNGLIFRVNQEIYRVNLSCITITR